MTSEQRLEFTNEAKDSIILWLEPWAEDYELRPGDQLKIEIVSKSAGVPQLEYRVGELVVHTWSQCRCRIFLNQTEVTRSSYDVETP